MNYRSSLPTVPLEKVLELVDSGTWGEEAELGTGCPVLRSTDIEDDSLVLNDPAWRQISPRDRERKKLRSGDIIVTKSSGSAQHIGKCCIFENPGNDVDYYFSNFTLRLRADKQTADPRWLHYWLTSAAGRTILHSLHDTTSGLRNLNLPSYLEQRIPLPSLYEQQRIAAILDKARAIRRSQLASPDQTRHYIQSMFRSWFCDSANGPTRWPVRPLSSLVDANRPITYGILKPGPDMPDGIPYVRVVDIQRDRILSTQVRRTTRAIDQEFRRSRLEPGDILLTIRGQVGRLAIVPSSLKGANITQDTARIAIADTGLVGYLFWFLESPAVQRWMAKHTKGVAVKGINLADVKDIPVPVPPADLAVKFGEFQGKAMRLRTSQELRNKLAQDLFESLVSRAFHGEL